MRYVHVPAALLSVALSAPLAAQAQTPVELKEYGIGFATPAGYRRPAPKEIPPQAAQAAYIAVGPLTNNFIANLTVVTQEVPFAAMPSNFGQIITAQQEQQMAGATENFKFISKKQTLVAGAQAFETSSEFRLKGQTTTIRNRQVYIVKNSRLYKIAFTSETGAFAAQSPVFDTFLKSVRWLPAAKAAK